MEHWPNPYPRVDESVLALTHESPACSGIGYMLEGRRHTGGINPLKQEKGERRTENLTRMIQDFGSQASVRCILLCASLQGPRLERLFCSVNRL